VFNVLVLLVFGGDRNFHVFYWWGAIARRLATVAVVLTEAATLLLEAGALIGRSLREGEYLLHRLSFLVDHPDCGPLYLLLFILNFFYLHLLLDHLYALHLASFRLYDSLLDLLFPRFVLDLLSHSLHHLFDEFRDGLLLLLHDSLLLRDLLVLILNLGLHFGLFDHLGAADHAHDRLQYCAALSLGSHLPNRLFHSPVPVFLVDDALRVGVHGRRQIGVVLGAAASAGLESAAGFLPVLG